MKTHRPGNKGRLLILPVLLLVVALVGVACAPATPGTNAVPAPSAAPAAPATEAPAQPEASQAPAGELDIPVGVDADGNFYRGDPKAAVKLVEFSDYQ